MGRETKYLLALLGLLAGVFCGVVSLKLFVPRPPVGVGPDVHGDLATTAAQALVEPPELSPPPALADFRETAPPPLAADTAEFTEPESPPPSSRFGGAAAPRDPFVVVASSEEPELPVAPPVEPAAAAEPQQPAELLPPPAFERPAAGPPAVPEPESSTAAPAALTPPAFQPGLPPPAPATLGEAYVARAGDSWWSLAERAYGDGRLYRALFAWNRMIDPRVSLAPGTRLEIPPAATLGATWPGLLPRD
jgi:hypothetical protein